MHHLALTLVLPAALFSLPIQQAQEPRPQVQPPVAAPAPVAPAPTVPDANVAKDAKNSQFSAAQLEQIVAPIALYPDVLLSQVLMASTYPLEIVEASRFMQANSKLAGAELENALKDKDWDPSVKSLCGFPDLLARMNDNLDWMRDLGDAFLAQEAELMDAAQRMRRNAFAAGTLKSTKEQTVTEQDDSVVIEPASTEVIYVPVYYPTSVYRGWGYPWWYYPSLYVGPPPGAPFFYFHVGFGWGPWSPWMWGRCNWHRGHSHVDVDVRVHNTFVTRTSVDARRFVLPPSAGPSTTWQHDPAHRRGVNYRDPALRQRPDATPTTRPPRLPPDELRGRIRPPRTEPNSPRPRVDAPRPNQNPLPPRPAPSPRPPGSPRPPKPPHGGEARGVLDGVRNPALDRAASERGYRSLRPYWQRSGMQPMPRPNRPPHGPNLGDE